MQNMSVLFYTVYIIAHKDTIQYKKHCLHSGCVLIFRYVKLIGQEFSIQGSLGLTRLYKYSKTW